MARLHRYAGFVILALFVASGAWMRLGLDCLAEQDDAGHLLYRSAHLHILFVGPLHVALGLGRIEPGQGWRRRCRQVGSTLLLLAPVAFLVAFCREPATRPMARLATQLGVYASALGMLLHLIAARRHRPDGSTAPPSPHS